MVASSKVGSRTRRHEAVRSSWTSWA